MRKASIDRPWVAAEYTFVVPSQAMPGFNLRIQRTDGLGGPPDKMDLDRMVHLHLKKTEVSHLRNYRADGPSTTFDVTVETLPVILESPASPRAAPRAELVAPPPSPETSPERSKAAGSAPLQQQTSVGGV